MGKNQLWEHFDVDFPRYNGDDIEITCYGIQSRVRSGHPDALYEARPLWFVARELPESCTPLLTALVQDQRITPEDVWTRVRVALEGGQIGMARARRAVSAGRPAARLPHAHADHEQPRRLPRETANRREDACRPRDGDVRRLSPRTHVAPAGRGPLDPARKPLQPGRPRLRVGPDRVLRRHAARPRRARVVCKGARPVRSAARLEGARGAAAAQLADVLAAIDAMTDKERGESAWRYWKARALKTAGRQEEAVALLKPLAANTTSTASSRSRSWATRCLRRPPCTSPARRKSAPWAENLGIRRALELYRLNLRLDATREWVWAIRGFDDRQLLAAAEVARRNEIFDRAINTADKTESLHDFSLRYLAPYRDVLKDAREPDEPGRGVGLRPDPAGKPLHRRCALLGRRERPDAAHARDGEVGGAENGHQGWRSADVTEVDTNVSLGTYYLRHVLDTLDGQPVLASAAYNAGPGRARAWRPDTAVEGAIYAETIPFNETRDYVKKVMSNASYYAHNFSQQMQSLKQRLGTIGPRQRDREAKLGDTP